jgi:hypothetical protein
MSDYTYLVGKRFIDDEDKREYEVVKIDVMRDRSIVAYVKWVREPYSRSKLMDAPIHVGDIVRMLHATEFIKKSATMEKEEKEGEGR